jgi:two-component system sensor histidine kinase KdpD
MPRRILAELAIVAVDLALATLVGAVLDRLGLGADAIVIVYVLAVQVVSLATASHVVCGVATALSAALFCFFFTEPRYHLVAWGSEYPGTFAVMCVVAFVSSMISVRLRRNARESQAASHMMRVLLQTNHALQRCDSVQSVMGEAGRQLARLVSGTVVLYLPNASGLLEPGALFLPDGTDAPLPDAGALDGTGVIAGPRAPRQPNVPVEVTVAMRAFENGEPAGSGTSLFSSASGFYLPVGEKDGPLGVFAVLSPGRAALAGRARHGTRRRGRDEPGPGPRACGAEARAGHGPG